MMSMVRNLLILFIHQSIPLVYAYFSPIQCYIVNSNNNNTDLVYYRITFTKTEYNISTPLYIHAKGLFFNKSYNCNSTTSTMMTTIDCLIGELWNIPAGMWVDINIKSNDTNTIKHFPEHFISFYKCYDNHEIKLLAVNKISTNGVSMSWRINSWDETYITKTRFFINNTVIDTDTKYNKCMNSTCQYKFNKLLMCRHYNVCVQNLFNNVAQHAVLSECLIIKTKCKPSKEISSADVFKQLYIFCLIFAVMIFVISLAYKCFCNEINISKEQNKDEGNFSIVNEEELEMIRPRVPQYRENYIYDHLKHK